MNERDEHRGVFIAAPMPDKLVATWAKLSMLAIDNCRFSEIFTQDGSMRRDFPHLTFEYLGTTNKEGLFAARNSILNSANLLKEATISLKSVEVIGTEQQQALVISVEESPALEQFSAELNKGLSENTLSLAFKPHFTIIQLHNPKSVEKARDWASTLEQPLNQKANLNEIAIYSKSQDSKTKLINLFSVKI